MCFYLVGVQLFGRGAPVVLYFGGLLLALVTISLCNVYIMKHFMIGHKTDRTEDQLGDREKVVNLARAATNGSWCLLRSASFRVIKNLLKQTGKGSRVL